MEQNRLMQIVDKAFYLKLVCILQNVQFLSLCSRGGKMRNPGNEVGKRYVTKLDDYLRYPRKDTKKLLSWVCQVDWLQTLSQTVQHSWLQLLTSEFYVLKKEDIFTIPNLLSTLRILATPVLGYLIVTEDYTSSLALFGVAGLTDMVRYNCTFKHHILFLITINHSLT